MSMRVTASMVRASSMRDLSRALNRLQTTQEKVSSGKQLTQPSDDPTSVSNAMSLRNQVRRAEQRERALVDAKGWVGVTDTALTSTLEMLTRVKELSVRGGNTGSTSPTARQAIATELRSLRDELLAVANTEYRGRSVFNGAASGPAYDDTGTYVGDAAVVNRDVAPGTTVAINLTGEQVYGDQAAPEGDLFAVLGRLADAVENGDMAALATEQAHLETAAERVGSAAGEVGARGMRLERVEARTSAEKITLQQALSQLEDVDLAEAIIDLNSHQTAYEATLQAAARVLPTSLLDYLR